MDGPEQEHTTSTTDRFRYHAAQGSFFDTPELRQLARVTTPDADRAMYPESGEVVDLSGRSNVPWLDGLGDFKETDARELLLDQRKGSDWCAAYGHIYIGRNRFEIVRRQEVEWYRQERDFNRRQELPASLNLDVDLSNVTLIAGNSSTGLAQRIGARLGLLDETSFVHQSRFKNSESRIIITSDLINRDVYLIQSLSSPVNDHLVELKLMIDAVRRAGADRVTLVSPFLAYTRQDRPCESEMREEPISVAMLIGELHAQGVDRIVTVDIHSKQSLGIFPNYFRSLSAADLIFPFVRDSYAHKKICLVGPDASAAKNMSEPAAHKLAEFLGREEVPSTGLDKVRDWNTGGIVVRDRNMSSVEGAVCIMMDDMIDSGGTTDEGALHLLKAGAEKVVAFAAHPIFSRTAVEDFRCIRELPDGRTGRSVEQLIVTDSIPLYRSTYDPYSEQGEPFIKVLHLDEPIARCIGKMANYGHSRSRIESRSREDAQRPV